MKIKNSKGKNRMKRTAIHILLNIATIAIIFLILNVNFQISPQDNMHTRSNRIKFEWFGLSNVKLDGNPEFSSPIEISQNSPVIELKPGNYYWKAGLSKTRSFVIDSEVSVAVNPAVLENETYYKIENQGNTKLLLDIIRNIMGLTGRVVLEPKAVTYENASGIQEIIASENE